MYILLNALKISKLLLRFGGRLAGEGKVPNLTRISDSIDE